jgi:adenosine deaminase
MRDELAFNRKTNYVSGFYRVKNIRFVPCRSMYVQEENYKCYKQQGLTTYSAMRVELTFNRKTNYVSGFYSEKNISFVPCRSMYFQEDNYKCYKQGGLKTCSAMRVELACNSKTNYVSGFYSENYISFVPCRSMYFQEVM